MAAFTAAMTQAAGLTSVCMSMAAPIRKAMGTKAAGILSRLCTMRSPKLMVCADRPEEGPGGGGGGGLLWSGALGLPAFALKLIIQKQTPRISDWVNSCWATMAQNTRLSFAMPLKRFGRPASSV